MSTITVWFLIGLVIGFGSIGLVALVITINEGRKR